MWVADMDFLPPEPVVQALVERAACGDYGYPDGVMSNSKDLIGLRNAIIERLEGLYHWQVEPQDLFFLPGVIPGINLACHAFAVPNGILVQPPVYPPIYQAARTTGALHQEAEIVRQPDGSYRIDWAAFESAFTAQTRLFILCNPHNPVGKVYRRDELEHMAEICLDKGVIIVADEIHSDLVYTGNHHIPIATLGTEIAKSTITLIAPSKTFNLAGLQCSVAIIQNDEIKKKFTQSRKGLVPWVNLFGLVAAEAAYREGQDWLEQVLIYLEVNRNALVDFVERELPGVQITSPEGTYLAWLDFREMGIHGSPYQFFLEKARVALNDGATFGSGGEGFVRLNFACPKSLLMKGLSRMQSAMKSTIV